MGPAPSRPDPVYPGFDPKSAEYKAQSAELAAKEHELFSASQEKAKKSAYAGGLITGFIGGKVVDSLGEKVETLIDQDPFKAWTVLYSSNVVSTTDWKSVLAGTKQTTGFLDNPVTNVAAHVGGTVQNVTKVVENVAAAAENVTGAAAGLTEVPWALIAVGGVAALILLRS